MSLPRVHTLDLDPAHCEVCRALAERLGAVPEEFGQPTDWPAEPSITINGRELSMGQAMVVRVGMSAFLMLLEDPEHRADFGPVGESYVARTREVLRMIHPRSDV